MKSSILFALISTSLLTLNAQNTQWYVSPFSVKNNIRQTHNRSVPDWRPGQEKYSEWDSKGSIWNLINTNDYSYDNSHLIESFENYESASLTDQRISYTYNAAGAVETTVYENWNGSIYEFVSKQVTLYSSSGEETGYEGYTWDGSNWVLNDGQRRVDIYTSSNLNSASYETYDFTNSSWVAYSDYILTYTPENKIDEIVFRMSNSSPGVLQNFYKFSCAYSPSAVQPDSIYLYQWDGSNWILGQRAIDIQWNSEGIIIVELEPTDYILQNYNVAGWINSERQTTMIDGLNQLVIVESSDGETWTDASRTTIEYDAFGNININKYEIFDGSTWTISDFYSYTNSYDGESRLTTIEAQNWNNSFLALQNNYKREFLNFVDVSGISTVETYQLNVYPNPANSILNVISSDVKSKTYFILDVTGKIVMKGNFQNSEMNQIGLDSLNAGYYILQIDATRGRKAISFVKQ